MRTFVSLFWQVTTLKAHTFFFFFTLPRAVCYTGVCTEGVGVFKFSLYSCKGAWKKWISNFKKYISHNAQEVCAYFSDIKDLQVVYMLAFYKYTFLLY